jgi:hypothetical protein
MSAQAIMELMTNIKHDKMVKDAIASALEGIQCRVIIARLPKKLLETMNMWARTEWYDEDGGAKFEKCLWEVVSRELKTRVFDLLSDWMIQEGGLAYPEKDLFYALCTASNSLHYYKEEYWPTMGAELEAEALHWVKEHDEGRLIESCDGGYFQYYDCVNEEVCQHMPHRHKPLDYEEQVQDQEEEQDQDQEEEEEEEEIGLVLVGAETLVPC